MPLVGGLIKRSFTLANRVQGLGQSPTELQRKTLRRLLRRAQSTAFGEHYKFSDILFAPDVIRAYQEKVDLFDYDKMHDQWWHRALNNEENVSWQGHIEHYALSSGTTGAPSKYIPMPDTMIRAIKRAGLKNFFAVTRWGLPSDFFTGEGLYVGGSSTLKPHNGYLVGDLSGITLQNRPKWIEKRAHPDMNIQRLPDWNTRIKAIAKDAANWDIRYITGIPSWVLLVIENVLAKTGAKNIHEVWPNLQVYVHGGIAFEPYREALNRVMGKPMIYIDTYLASEGFIAFQNRPESRSMAILLNNSIFHEFIPFNSDNFDSDGNLIGKPRAYHIGEVKEGIDYALVISTCAGSWRYLIGDTVRFTDVERKEIIITGRTKHFLSVVGEHLSVDNMNQGIIHAANILGTAVKEFTVQAVESDGSFAHRFYIGCDDKIDAEAFRILMDDKMKEVNDDYATERNSALRTPQIHLLPNEVFHDFMKHINMFGGQAKFPRVMKKDKFAQFEAFVAENRIEN
jgi:GH3 auxin-responsive promoter